MVHGRGGGTEKFLIETLIRTQAGYRHYVLRSLDDRWHVSGSGSSSPPRDYRWRTASEATVPCYEFTRDSSPSRWLRPLCAWLGIDLVHVHSLVGGGEQLVASLRSGGLPYVYTAHDMFLPCPTVYLINDRGQYCGATTDPDTCQRCLSAQGLQAVDIVRWRQRFADFLAGATRVWAPSAWARDTLLRYFPAASVQVMPPHPDLTLRASPHAGTEMLDLPSDARVHIGVLGAIGAEKGARTVEAMAARIVERGLRLRVVVIGYMDRMQRGVSYDSALAVHGPYEVADVPRWLDAYGIPLLVFPTVWPETFGYTLSEVWAAGRPALVPAEGALAERVRATGAGWTMANALDVDAWLDRCLALTLPANAGELGKAAELAIAAAAGERARGSDPYASLVQRRDARPVAGRDFRVVLQAARRAARTSASAGASQ